MGQYTGKSIYDEIAIGKIYFYSKNRQQIKCSKVTNIEAEMDRYERAKAIAVEQLYDLYEKAVVEVGETNAMLFKVHAMMLDDNGFNNAIYNMIKNEGINAEYAVVTTGDGYAKRFSDMEDEYFKTRSADIKDITERLIMALTGTEQSRYIGDEPVIIVADDVSPSEIVQMDKKKLLGFVTEHGSVHSHTAILARMMNIPVLNGVQIQEDWDGKMAIIDGKEGKLIIEPDNETLDFYFAQQKKEEEARRQLVMLKGRQDVTVDGREIMLYANIGSVNEVTNVLANDAAGIGLFRSEFLYLERDEYPTEEELFHVYKTVAQSMAGKKVVIRTLDIGADKQADYFNIEKEKNPAMGYRAIRICLDRKDLFKTQLSAIYRAAAFGSVSILFPMIISLKEVQEIKAICEEIKTELDATHTNYGKVELGIMIETPAAVMISDMLAKEVDFFSIGTNDLTQYTLAIDRQNEKLDSIYDAHHPAILRMIQMVVENGHREGCRVGICGELAADTSLTETFIKMGIDELSVPPNRILPVRKMIRGINFSV